MHLRTPRPKLKVLIAEDDPDQRGLLREELLLMGHQPELCRDGREARIRITRGRFDLLLVDHRMPYFTGLEVVLTIRKRGLRIPAVLMSAHIDERVVFFSRRIPRLRLLPKPFSYQELRYIIRTMIAND